jgi:hypothetical protein
MNMSQQRYEEIIIILNRIALANEQIHNVLVELADLRRQEVKMKKKENKVKVSTT